MKVFRVHKGLGACSLHVGAPVCLEVLICCFVGRSEQYTVVSLKVSHKRPRI